MRSIACLTLPCAVVLLGCGEIAANEVPTEVADDGPSPASACTENDLPISPCPGWKRAQYDPVRKCVGPITAFACKDRDYSTLDVRCEQRMCDGTIVHGSSTVLDGLPREGWIRCDEAARRLYFDAPECAD